MRSIAVLEQFAVLLPERETLSFIHIGNNYSRITAWNSSYASSQGYFNIGNSVTASATQFIIVNQS